jgi:hypothetical protein
MSEVSLVRLVVLLLTKTPEGLNRKVGLFQGRSSGINHNGEEWDEGLNSQTIGQYK